MGNKLGRRRQVVDERYTRPQGLYVHKDVDIKKLKKLILESKLAPCYPGDDECCCDLEECPICFLYYPSLNRSRCCMKGICTECFLQMKNPNSARPTQCPFCKTTNYAVEYRGVKTKEEKGIEQVEEQRVIEAKIRMRQQELQDEEARTQKRQELSSSSTSLAPGEVEYNSVAVSSSRSLEGEEIVLDSCATPINVRQPVRLRTNGDDEFDLDLEDIMVMEAIWLSIQENGRLRNPAFDASEQFVMEGRYVQSNLAPMACSSSSPSGGLACAIAALAERQQTGGESSLNDHRNVSAFGMLPGSGRLYDRVDQDAENYPPAESSTSASPDSRAVDARDEGDWGADRGSEVAEAGTSYASPDVTEVGSGNSALPQSDEIVDNFQNVPAPIVPESFEEQMMLAMAVSLAEARSGTSGSGISWQ